MGIQRCEETCNSPVPATVGLYRSMIAGQKESLEDLLEGLLVFICVWVVYTVGATLLLKFGENASPGLTHWCVIGLATMSGCANTSDSSLELWLNPEESGKANGQEQEHESPNCPVAHVADRLHSQTVKRICVATLVRGPRCDVGSCMTEASGTAVRYSNLSDVLPAKLACMSSHYSWCEGGHVGVNIKNDL